MAAAAYQSGDRLFCEYDQKPKHYRNKKEVVFSTILAPPHVPPALTDRNALWNSVEASEKRYDAQLARRVVMALPKEISREQQIQLMQEYCEEQFVSKGMIADISIHDKGDGNPHAHVLLTMRPVDENGKWAPKGRMVYDLDEYGQKQKTAKGNWKCHKEPTVDWNDRKYAEIWRHAWEETVNHYYAENGLAERVDLRSYERQGIDAVPTVHMGPAVTQMEKKGVRTNIGDLNRDIISHNRNRRRLRQTILTVSVQLEKLYHERTDMAVRVFPFDRPRELVEMLWDYYDIRADERHSWFRYAQRECSLNALKKLSRAICWLQEQKLYTLESYETAFEQLKQDASEAANAIDAMKQERHSLETWHKHLINRKRYRPVYEKYAGKMFKANQEKYADEHREELDKYRAAVRYFKAHPERENTDASALVDKHRQLKTDIDGENDRLDAIQQRMEPFSRIACYISQACRPRPDVLDHEERNDLTPIQNNHPDIRNRMEDNAEASQPSPQRKRRNHDLSL